MSLISLEVGVHGYICFRIFVLLIHFTCNTFLSMSLYGHEPLTFLGFITIYESFSVSVWSKFLSPPDTTIHLPLPYPTTPKIGIDINIK